MGKILIIKGADFSANNVDIVPVYYNGSFTPSKTNYQSELHKNIVVSTGKWSNYSAADTTLSYPLRNGSVVTIPGDQAKNTIIGLVNTLGGYDEAVDFMTGQNGQSRQASYGWPIKLRATADGYLTLLSSNNGDDAFPSNPLVSPYDNTTRVLSGDSPDFGDATKYMNSGGTYGNTTAPEGKFSACFFNVFKGEIVNVTAQSARNANIAFCSFQTSGQILPAILGGQSRQSVTAGTTQQFTVPEDCLIYVFCYDGNTLYFPESITVTGV